MSNKNVYIASDHRGFPLKQACVDWMKAQGFEVHDLGPEGTERVDASDFAVRLVSAMRGDPDSRGILICGTGQVMAMTANRFKHIRAALCVNLFMTRLARQHNNANVLAMGANIVGEALALECVETFLNTEFLGGRYGERCQMLTDLGGL